MRSAPELIDDGVESNPAKDDESWTVEVEDSAYKFPLIARFGILMGVLVLLFVSMLALLPIVLPPSVTIAKAEKLIGAIVGMDVSIKGEHSFRILPSLRLQAENVVQSNGDGPVEMHLPYLEIEMSSFGALSGSVDLNRLLLRGPSVKIGQVRSASIKPAPSTEIDHAWGWWRDMSIDELRVENGAFSLVDGRTGRAQKLEQFNVKNVASSTGDPDDGLKFEGQGVLNDQAIKLFVVTSNPQLLVSGMDHAQDGLRPGRAAGYYYRCCSGFSIHSDFRPGYEDGSGHRLRLVAVVHGILRADVVREKPADQSSWSEQLCCVAVSGSGSGAADCTFTVAGRR